VAPDTHHSTPDARTAGDQGRHLLQEFHRREANPRAAVRPRMREGVDKIAVGVFLQQGEKASARCCLQLYCSLVRYESTKLTRECEGNIRDAAPCRAAAVAKERLISLYARDAQAIALMQVWPASSRAPGGRAPVQLGALRRRSRGGLHGGGRAVGRCFASPDRADRPGGVSGRLVGRGTGAPFTRL